MYINMKKVIDNCIVLPIKRLARRIILDRMNDKQFIEYQWKKRMGGTINWDNPRTFSEKIQWTKLYYHNPMLNKLVDKYEVKKYVADRIGEDHVIPCYGVWDSFDEIDFAKLPNQFVLKCTHDSGSFVICKDKSTFDFKMARKKLTEAQKQNYYYIWREWAYKDVQPRIIAEKYIDSLGHPESIEYKLTCFDGKVKVITVCQGIAHAELSQRTNDHFDRDFKRQNWYAFYKPSNKEIEKPAQMDDIIAYSEKLSEGFPQVRVDWYVVDGIPFFGEMTFYTWMGFIEFEPKEWDNVMGDWFKLPEKQL